MLLFFSTSDTKPQKIIADQIIEITKKIDEKGILALDWSDNEGADWSDSGDHMVTFYPRGFSSGGEMLISLVEGGKRRQLLQINKITGRVKVLKEEK